MGYTQDYVARLEQHNTSDRTATFTSKHRPWTLQAVFSCGADEALAMRIERFIKKQKSRKLIERLVQCHTCGTECSGELAQLVIP